MKKAQIWSAVCVGIVFLLLIPFVFSHTFDSGTASIPHETFSNYKLDLSSRTDVFVGDYPVNDSVSLEDGITATYSAQELHSFFSLFHTNQPKEQIQELLRYSQINKVFPVEVTRSAGYSVYRVAEGGYYYIFWGQTLDPDTNLPDGDPILTYSTYISEPIDLARFAALEVNASTANLVSEIDPYCELRLDMSRGLYSFSYCGADELIMVTYSFADSAEKQVNNLDDLIVTKVSVVDQQSTPSHFSWIRTEDLP